MRTITQNASRAFINSENFKQSNTVVFSDSTTGITTLYLHGHAIATRDHNTGTVQISSAGWETNTTKERLNGLHSVGLPVQIRQIAHVWHLNGTPWENTADWTTLQA